METSPASPIIFALTSPAVLFMLAGVAGMAVVAGAYRLAVAVAAWLTRHDARRLAEPGLTRGGLDRAGDIVAAFVASWESVADARQAGPGTVSVAQAANMVAADAVRTGASAGAAGSTFAFSRSVPDRPNRFQGSVTQLHRQAPALQPGQWTLPRQQPRSRWLPDPGHAPARPAHPPAH